VARTRHTPPAGHGLQWTDPPRKRKVTNRTALS
jgi:hypothetical protein